MTTPTAEVWVAATAVAGAITLDEATLMPLGTAAAVFAGVWWMGRKLQSLEDGLDGVRAALKELPCRNPTEGCEKRKV